MLEIFAIWAVVAILCIGVGAVVSWLIVRRLPVKRTTKLAIFCAVFVAVFSPIFLPITGAGVFLFPALGIGILDAFWTPWNFATLPTSAVVAMAIGKWLLPLNSPKATVEHG